MKIYWHQQSRSNVPPEEVWLSLAEMAHLRGLRFAKRRADWLLGRWTAKNAVAMFLGSTADFSGLADIEIRPAVSGVPQAFFRHEPAPISMSLSHRDGVALCVLAADRVLLGCDLETVEPHSDAFAADYFNADEQALVQQVSRSDRDRLLSLLWSSKESALKALGEGLRLDTRQVTVNVRDMLEQQKEDIGSRSQCSSFCIRQSSPVNGWRPLEVRTTNGQILQGWWSQTATRVRTVLAVPRPHPPVRMTK